MFNPVELTTAEDKPSGLVNHSEESAGWFSAWIPPSWRESLAFLWFMGAAFFLGWTALHVMRFQRLLRYAHRAPATLQLEVNTLGQRLGLAQSPQLWLVPGAVSPMLWAMGGKPRLLFPTKLLEQLNAEQRATLLVHELAHVRRGDHWVRYLELVGLALYWWHPIVWWARRELREAEEQCCDAWVVATLPAADRTYATAIVQTVAFFSQVRCALPAAASGIGQVRQLRRRLTMIMQGGTPRSLSWAGFLVLLGLGLLSLPFWPVRAQDKGDQLVQADDKSADAIDQKIAEVKKLLQALEEKKKEGQQAKDQKQADVLNQKKAAEAKMREAELAKARATAEKWGALLKERHKALMEAQTHYQEAMQIIAKLEGKPGAGAIWYTPAAGKDQPYSIYVDPKTGKQLEFTGKVVPAQGAWRYEVITKPGADAKGKDGVWSYELRNYEYHSKDATKLPKADQKPPYYELKAGGNAPLDVKKVPPSAQDRADELDKKLDRLFKEVEELRRELRKYRPDKPDASGSKGN
jgi:hypothetical protein